MKRTTVKHNPPAGAIHSMPPSGAQGAIPFRGDQPPGHQAIMQSTDKTHPVSMPNPAPSLRKNEQTIPALPMPLA